MSLATRYHAYSGHGFVPFTVSVFSQLVEQFPGKWFVHKRFVYDSDFQRNTGKNKQLEELLKFMD